ncbi:MAG: hypothetical protein AAGE76_02530 [Pseudomonadota bacterium]
MRPLILSSGIGAVLAACSPAPEGPTFTSKQEETCFQQAQASLPEDRQLRRDREGAFVEVLLVEDRVRDIDRSQTFEECMAAASRVGTGSLADLGTVNFTEDELLIWNTLNDAARKAALEFIQAGGTLAEFVAPPA